MQKLLLVGLNHTTAPLSVRERIVFSGQERNVALAAFRQRFPEAEAVLLSTCNRVELYVGRGVHGHPREEEMVDFLAAYHNVDPREVGSHLYRKVDRDVVNHLFGVASSLDSMVLGETQILGQVREAYDLAKSCGSAGAALHPLFQRAIGVGKQVMSETALSEGRLSVASVAVDYARQIFDSFGDKTVLCIGAGKMAALVMQSFKALSPGRLLVCNRDPAKAVALCGRFGGVPAAYETLAEHLVAADIVITSTGAPHAIIGRATFEQVVRQRRYRPVFLIDIALPRDVEASVGDLENVYLYNIDDLQQVVAGTQSARGGAVGAAKAIVEREVEAFLAWLRGREMGPVIDQLYKRCQEMAAEEVARVLNKMPGASAEERAQVEEMARRIVNKLLHEPVKTLRGAGSLHGGGPQYLHAVERLFGLGNAATEGTEGTGGESSGGERS